MFSSLLVLGQKMEREKSVNNLCVKRGGYTKRTEDTKCVQSIGVIEKFLSSRGSRSC